MKKGIGRKLLTTKNAYKMKFISTVVSHYGRKPICNTTAFELIP